MIQTATRLLEYWQQMCLILRHDFVHAVYRQSAQQGCQLRSCFANDGLHRFLHRQLDIQNWTEEMEWRALSGDPSPCTR